MFEWFSVGFVIGAKLILAVAGALLGSMTALCLGIVAFVVITSAIDKLCVALRQWWAK